MARSRLKEVAQRVALRTQFPPFTRVYRLLYAAGIRLCVQRLRRVRGLRAIYLRRGLAAGRPVYGLSDIDLLAMVDGGPEGRAAAQVRYQYAFMRRLVPMLAPVEELEVYDPATFAALYDASPFYRNRFDRGRHAWRRLYGEDVFARLPAEDPEARTPAREDLKPAWRYLAQELIPGGDDRPDFIRSYTAYKVLAEAARAVLIEQGAAPSLERDTAIAEVAQRDEDVRDALDLARGIREGSATWDGNADPFLRAFVDLARKAFRTAGVSPYQQRLRVRPITVEDLAIVLDDASLRDIEHACSAVKGVEHAVFVPRLDFDALAILDLDPAARTGATTDAFDLVLLAPDLPSAEQLSDLNRVLDPHHPAIAPWFSDGRVALALRPSSGPTVRSRDGSPEFFAALEARQPLHGILCAAGGVDVQRGFAVPRALERRAETLLRLFADNDVFRLPEPDFYVLLWEACRAAEMASQEVHKPIDVPVTSADIVETLSRRTPDAAPVLRQVHDAYLRELRGKPSEAARFTQWSAAYASRLARGIGSSADAFAGGEPSGDLPARAELTISVMIVTRNRASMLRDALESLRAQTRPPEEVVVVDNASTDDTQNVARSFASDLNLKLIREDNVGIPHARNRALEEGSGDIVAVMDDDCVADRRWLEEIERPFLKDPRIGAVGGSLVPLEGPGRGLINRFYNDRMRGALAALEADDR